MHRFAPLPGPGRPRTGRLRSLRARPVARRRPPTGRHPGPDGALRRTRTSRAESGSTRCPSERSASRATSSGAAAGPARLPHRPLRDDRGRARARRERRSRAEASIFAYPFDLAGPVERALDATRPGLVLLTETEIWPLFLERAARRGVPVALVNGRISERSFRALPARARAGARRLRAHRALRDAVGRGRAPRERARRRRRGACACRAT